MWQKTRLEQAEDMVGEILRNKTIMKIVGIISITGIGIGLWFLIQPDLLGRLFGKSIAGAGNTTSLSQSSNSAGSIAFDDIGSASSFSSTSSQSSSSQSSTSSTTSTTISTSSAPAAPAEQPFEVSVAFVPVSSDGAGQTCPYVRLWQANITSNKSGNTKFTFVRSDGIVSPEQSYDLDGVQTITTIFSWSNTRTQAWVELNVSNPSLRIIRQNADNNCTVPIQQQQVYTVAAVGDIACSTSEQATNTDPNKCQSGRVAQLLQSLNPDKILLLGDIQYNTGSLGDFQTVFGPQFGSFGDRLLPSPGNHEYDTPAATGYYSYFSNPQYQSGYYAQQLGQWNIVSLNSNCDEIDCSTSGAQYQWLSNQLSSNACTISFWHHPPYTSGTVHASTTWYDDLWNLQLNRNVALNLSGHVHNYERFAPVANTTPIVIGTGGKGFYPFGSRLPGSITGNDNNFGVLLLKLQGKTITYEFHSVDNGILDSGIIGCQY
jgi:acid phosphatase type 7